MSKLFTISQCYSEIIPESTELGDFDDQGFELEPCNEYSLNEAFNLIKNTGTQYIELQGNRFFVSSGYYTICYKEMREREVTTFLEFKTEKQAKRVFKIFKEKLQLY